MTHDAAETDHPPEDGGSLARGTLGRRLVLRVVTILAVVAIAVSTVSLVAVNRMLLDQLDSQLGAVQVRQPRDDRDDRDDDDPPGTGEFGNPIGTVKLEGRSGRVLATLLTEEGLVPIPQGVVDQLLQVDPSGGTRTLTLEGLGTYRVKATARGGSQVQVVGLPLSTVTQVLGRLALVEAAVVVAALLAAVLITRAVVVNSLRPLNRVATAARAVSRLELGRGEVDLPVRVQPADADPGNEVGRVGQALNHLIDHVESALAARQRSESKVRQFVADASHELRNPLASIRGYAELTRRGREQLPETTRFAMSRIEAESDRMSRLVDDMLLLARLDNDQGVDPRPTDVVELVLNAVADARAAGPTHRWVVDLPDLPVMAAADPHRLTQVVVNVLSNARKHTPAHTTVTTSVAREGGWAVIEVTDDGPGIPPEVRESMFERFARADTARTHGSEPSTGLGLAIVQAVMTAHGGTVEAQSVPGRTTFRLRLPLSQ